ncbi:hypothetical protein NW764_016635 [Fusarium oxysporum]|nr:hypothetical protein NW764_016635 [Fusarium oxysporum]
MQIDAGLKRMLGEDAGWKTPQQRDGMWGEKHLLHAAGVHGRRTWQGRTGERRRRAVRIARAGLGDEGPRARHRLHGVEERHRPGGTAAGCTIGGGQRRRGRERRVHRLRREYPGSRAAGTDLLRRVSHRHHRRRIPRAAGAAHGLAPVRVPAGDADGNAADVDGGLVPGADAGTGRGDNPSADDEGEHPVPGRAGEAGQEGDGRRRDGYDQGDRGTDEPGTTGRDLLPVD